MDKFATLEPTRLYHQAQPTPRSLFSRKPDTTILVPTIGRLPIDLHLLLLTHLPIPAIPSYSRASRATARLAADDRIWEQKWRALAIDSFNLAHVLDQLEANKRGAEKRATIPVEDEFGDFAQGNVGHLHNVVSPRTTFKAKYQRAHSLLKPFTAALDNPPHIILASLHSSSSSSTLLSQSRFLHLLSLFLSPQIQPLSAWQSLRSSLRSAIDRFDASLLAAFDLADSKNDEKAMREAAEASWEVDHNNAGDNWEMGKVWAEKREIFYEQGQWNPLDNVTHTGILDFDAMDDFMAHIFAAIREHGSRAVRVFPPSSQVLLAFADRVANEVVGEYITPLLTRAREISNEAYLQATAASFSQAWEMVDVLLEVAAQRTDSMVERTKAEDVIYRMFEINMDEYLDEEVESLKQAFEKIIRTWSKSNNHPASSPTTPAIPNSTRFLGSHNPALVKRNLLASFTDVLLLPVTIVPRTVGAAVGAALTTGGTAAAQGIAMLNPQRWGGGVQVGRGYSRKLGKEEDGVDTLFESGEDVEDEFVNGVQEKDPSSLTSSSQTTLEAPSITTSTTPLKRNQLELLLSLDIALELIHADRESLKRAETFAGYPGHYGHRVHDTIEEIFILLLEVLDKRHVSPGFGQATDRMTTYKPAEHEETTSVAPLLQFFELVHIGDTIQSMVQVYFDKELAPHIDRTDFLNGVVREKKRFENALDDSVAAGLNAGTEVLMNQVEHIIQTLTPARAYYPPEDAPLDLGPTHGCTEAIKCLEMHCKLLKGSTNKEVLEVFYQEVGIRLIGILHKHIKRQIISLSGGFQVIADLNTYYVFIASLKVPQITSDFSHLKMLGHVYVVEDARDLAQIVRDVTRYGGAYRPEDIYEFIQRRSDWKKIEKTVDKTMYNLSFKEDCVVC
ncbi:hypothetical protein PILCRDRAFT_615587 [Piloderma croceum F 1598]|uniref:Exocyst complex component Sec10-like alpha-helical bundle domain-containing protein n=1 Tax=Piloderma croceum (strain F 1598) TaxID=765440 RepID=A0A0C3BJX5_PILCF|nr:hypothetical protein PILCRDRAFT_615587 [Piloderma croceum F 1598]